MKKMGSLAGDNLDEDFDRMVDEAMEEAAQEEKSVGPDSNMPDGLSSSVTDSTAI
jgi:hypothetical protein